MKVTQICEFVNDALKQSIGETAVISEDLSNVVDVGTTIANANAWGTYAQALIDRIGRSIFVDRKYNGVLLSVMRDSWEFGSILMKVDSDIPNVSVNESWELVEGASYDPNIYYPDKTIKAKVYNNRVTFEIERSFSYLNLQESFTSASEMNRFVSMLYTQIENALTIALENLLKRGLNSLIIDTVNDDYNGASLSSKSGTKAVNLLKLYNDEFGTALDVNTAMHTKDFFIFSSRIMRDYMNKLKSPTQLFNVGKRIRWTSKDKLHVVTLSQFASASVSYAESSTYHNELVALPNYEEINFFQGTGEDYSFDNVSKIVAKSGSGNDLTLTGVVGVMFDDNALACNNKRRSITSNFNPKAEFYTYFYKDFMQLMNDTNEQVVVFFLA